MAGLGFKDFQVGEVLTSSDVDGYLMQQSVMNFADSAARGSALGTATGTAVPLAEGMVSYLQDTDSVEVYDGSAWTPVGSIKSVHFALGTAVQAASVPDNNTYVDVTDLSLTVTPKSAASKFLVVSGVSAAMSRSGFRTDLTLRLVRDATTLVDNTSQYTDSDANRVLARYDASYEDAPATTSSITYKTQVRQRASIGSETIYINRSESSATPISTSFLYLLEF